MKNDIRYLRSFIFVAEYLNFTKAAEHLYISQSALSKHILELEEQLGVKLFIRNHSMVQLTPAGFTLFKEARNLIDKIDEVFELTRQSQNKVWGTLKIGCASSAHVFLAKTLKRFRALYPYITLDICVLPIPTINRYLDLQVLDIGFNPFIDSDPKSPFKQQEVRRARLCFLLPHNHPYANKYSLDFCELAQERFILFDKPGSPFTDWFVQQCNKQGFNPNIVGMQPQMDTIFLYVAAGLGISFFCFDALYCQMMRNHISFVAMKGNNAYAHIGAVWKQENQNPSIPLFLNECNSTSSFWEGRKSNVHVINKIAAKTPVN
ncbi:MAG TPA: LysR family transcriptional regulator [Negativicutes bacterium]|jgi:DNA-binding transcriptional LysR family regulator